MSSDPTITDPTTWALDRQIVLVRVLDADGKTVLTLRQLHPTAEQRDAGIGFGAVELGLQTMQKLADHLAVA